MNIRIFRKRKGLTQVELAKALGLTQVAVANYERGVRKPDVTLLPKLAQLLGVGLEDLYGKVEKRAQEKEPKRVHRNSRTTKVQELFDALPPSEQRVILKQLQLMAQQRAKAA